ncbi:MAG: hypothetical protein KJN81_01970 [Acidimicrobiia bacterium]|nr:hypothetical protein [Acidimicrobiia bacterium]NNL27174.1 hypothetical protein [Acidimicrobiia bacterium]
MTLAELPTGIRVVGICHPDWRGVRTAAHSFGVPVLESPDLDADGDTIIDRLKSADVTMVVIHGLPPGTESFMAKATDATISIGAVHYSSPAQHGAGAAEWGQVTMLLNWLGQGTLHRLGFAKSGVAEVIRALGHEAFFVGARPPVIPDITPLDLGPGTHVGIFSEMFWRKNTAPQLGAVALMPESTAHVLEPIPVPYLQPVPHKVHGVVPWSEFVAILGSVDLNLYVSLAECLPLTPMESYRLGVPCLMSQTSVLFKDDRDLWERTTVGELDNPAAIAEASLDLMSNRDETVALANAWLDEWDHRAAETWNDFVS